MPICATGQCPAWIGTDMISGFFNVYYLLYMCAYIQACHNTHVKVKGQLVRVDSVQLSCVHRGQVIRHCGQYFYPRTISPASRSFIKKRKPVFIFYKFPTFT